MSVILFRKTTHRMMEMKAFWQDRQKEQKNCGIMYRNFRKKKEKRVAFWNAKQKLFPV